MKRSLLISEIFPPLHGGSGRWFWELYSRLNPERFHVAAGEHENARAFDKEHALALSRFPLSSWSWGIKSVDGLRYYFNAYRKLAKYIKQNDIQALHCGRCLPEGFIGFLLSKRFNIPLLCYIHGEDVEAAATSRELSWIVAKVLDRSQILICNSNNTASLVSKHWQIKQNKVRVLYPGVDADYFVPSMINSSVRADLAWHDRPTVLTVGRLQKRKGQDMMLQAIPKILEKLPNFLYAVVGGGEEKENLLGLCEQLNITQSVLFMDELSDAQMLACYQQCDLFILPNRTVEQDIEGFGMVLVEAQACGKTVVAGDSGGTKETMIVGETGFIIDCGDPDKIATLLTGILSNTGLLASMGKKGRAHVERELDWKIHTQKAESIFSLL